MKPLSPYSERLHNHYFLGGAQTLLGRVIDAHYDSSTGLVGLAGEFIIYDNKPLDKLGEPNLVAFNVAVVDSRTGIARKSNLRPAEPVLTITSDQGSGNFYFGGEFTYLHNSISNVGKFDLLNAESQLSKDFFASNLGGFLSQNTLGITAIASDGGNGAYIAGGFEVINGVYRQGLAQIDQNGKVTSWQPPSISGEIDALHVMGDNIYVGGSFYYDDLEAGISRVGGLAISRVTGEILPWNPNIYDNIALEPRISSITSIGDNIYFCGSFTSIGGSGGTSRYGLAAMNTNGDLLSWNPNTDTYLFAGQGPLTIVASGNTLYLGGSFTSVNGNTRNRLAAIDTAGSLLPWNPNANYTVAAIEVIGNNVYVGGSFWSVSNVSRLGLAAINTNGDLLTWNPSTDAVYALASEGDNIYVFGNFSTVNSTLRNSMAAINTSGSLLSWDPAGSVSGYLSANGFSIFSAAISGPSVYVGSTASYRDSSATERRHLAAMNSTGGLTSWDPSSSNDIFALAYHPSSGILAGGVRNAFLGGVELDFVPSINVSTGVASAFYQVGGDKEFNGNIYALAVDGSGSVYAGGVFTDPAYYLAKLDSSGAFVASWQPSANTVVRGIEVDGSNVYAFGTFSTINGFSRFGVALVNSSGHVQDWKPTPGGTVKGVAARNGNVYLRGTLENFATLSGYGGIFRRDDGLLTTPLEFNSNVWCSIPDGSGGFYVGGSFTRVNGVSRSRLAQINSSGGVTSWDPNVNNIVYALATIGSNIYIGGQFTSVSATVRNRLAAVNTTGNLLAWNPNSAGTVYTLEPIESNIYIGGGFTQVSSTTRNRLAAVNTNGNLLAWNPSASSTVCSLSSSGTNIYIGGSFVSIGSTTRNRLAAVNTNGNLLAWDPNANGSVAVLKSLGTNIYVGGSFNSVSGTSRLRVAAVNTNGNVLTWDPSASSTLSALSVLGSNIYIGGSFTTVLGSPENLVAVFGTDGQAKSFYPELIGSRVLTISPDPGSSYVFIGGEFRGSYIPDSDQSAYLAAVDSSGDLVSWMQGRLPQGVSIFESLGNTHAIIATQDTILMPTYDVYLDNYRGDPELDLIAGSRLSPLGIVTRLSDNKPIT